MRSVSLFHGATTISTNAQEIVEDLALEFSNESTLKIVRKYIKASNRSLDRDVNAKIFDFGLPKIVEKE